MKIGQVADAVGLSLRTVRYYEEVGLLVPAGRTPGGFRLYAADAVERLRVLKGMKPMGLTLGEIRELVEALDRTENPAELDAAALQAARLTLTAYAQRAKGSLAELEARVREVETMQERIRARIEQLDASPTG